MMCSYGCFAVQTNDQGREIVNEVSDELQLLADVQQWVTRAYHLQSSDLVERQNRTIKSSFVKILEENPLKWSSIIEGVLLMDHRVSKYSSTKYYSFNLLYNRETVLPTDVKYKLSSMENSDLDKLFGKDIFDAVLASSNVIRKDVHRAQKT